MKEEWLKKKAFEEKKKQEKKTNKQLRQMRKVKYGEYKQDASI